MIFIVGSTLFCSLTKRERQVLETIPYRNFGAKWWTLVHGREENVTAKSHAPRTAKFGVFSD